MRLSDRVLGIEEFTAVAEVGSFVAAAERLGLTASGVGKAVQRLELRLGVRLFTRTTRRVALTDDGTLFLERCRRLADHIDEAEAEVDARRTAIAGLVRIAAPLAYGRLRIVPALAPFLKAHPDLRLDLRLSDRIVDPIEERIDLIIRIGDLDDSGMWARAIDQVRFGVFAAPAYLAAHNAIVSPDDLGQHNRLGFLRGSGRPFAFTLQAGELQTRWAPSDQFVADDIEGVVAAAVSGLGLAYLPTFIAASAIADGTLVGVLGASCVDGPQAHLVYPQPRQMPRRVRSLADHLISVMREG